MLHESHGLFVGEWGWHFKEEDCWKFKIGIIGPLVEWRGFSWKLVEIRSRLWHTMSLFG